MSMSSGALSTILPALALVETDRAFLGCIRCERHTWHSYRATREGEWKAYVAYPGADRVLSAVVLHHVFACDRCGALRVWGASDPEMKWRSE